MKQTCPYKQQEKDLDVIVSEEDKNLARDCLLVWQKAYEEHTRLYGSAVFNVQKMYDKVDYQWTSVQLYRTSLGKELLSRVYVDEKA